MYQLSSLVLVSLQETRLVFNGYHSAKVDVPPSVLKTGSCSRLRILLVFLQTILVLATGMHKDCCNINVSDPKVRRKR